MFTHADITVSTRRSFQDFSYTECNWKFCLLLYDADTTYHLYILSSKVHMKKTECIYLKNPTTSRYMLHNKSKILPLNGKSITSSCLKNG